MHKNPELLKSAMDSFKSMPEEDRKKMMAAAQTQQASMAGGMPDMSKMNASRLQHGMLSWQ